MSVEAVQQLSRAEKLKLMEVLWDQLSQPEESFDSPAWHETALAETQQRLAEGKEQVVDWEAAKRQLRNQFD